jgi:hypothetical protein
MIVFTVNHNFSLIILTTIIVEAARLTLTLMVLTQHAEYYIYSSRAEGSDILLLLSQTSNFAHILT